MFSLVYYKLLLNAERLVKEMNIRNEESFLCSFLCMVSLLNLSQSYRVFCVFLVLHGFSSNAYYPIAIIADFTASTAKQASSLFLL